MVIPLEVMAEARDADGAETALGEGRAVRRAAEERDQAGAAGDAGRFRGLQERVGHALIREDGAVQVLPVDHELGRGMDRIIAEDAGRNIPVILLMRPAPRLGTAQAGLLRAGQEDADLRMLRADPLPLHLAEEGNAQEAAGEIVIGAVHNALRIVGQGQQEEERDEGQAPESGRTGPGAGAAQGADGDRQVKEDAGGGQDPGDLEDDPAEAVIQRELPGGVRMPVEEDPLPDLPGAWTQHRDIRPLPRGEEGIKDLPVEHEMEQEQQQPQAAEEDAEPRTEGEARRAQRIADGGEIKIPVEGIRVFPKTFHFHVRAAAFLPQDPGEVFGGLPLVFAAGAAGGEPPADPADLRGHPRNRFAAAAEEGIKRIHEDGLLSSC